MLFDNHVIFFVNEVSQEYQNQAHKESLLCPSDYHSRRLQCGIIVGDFLLNTAHLLRIS